MSKSAHLPRTFRRAVLGGTFDHFHRGHEALLRTGFSHAKSVGIGITSEEYLRRHPKPFADRLQPFSTRRRVVERWLTQTFPRREWWTTPVSSQLGGALDPRVDLLVVTVDTLEGARAVNRARRRRGTPPVSVLIAPLVLATDRSPISSRRIRAGVIDARGYRKKPLIITVLGAADSDRANILHGLQSSFARVPLRVEYRHAAVPPQAPRSSTAALRALGCAPGSLAPSEIMLGVVAAESRKSSRTNRRIILAIVLVDDSGVAVVNPHRRMDGNQWPPILKRLIARLRPKDSSLDSR